MEMEMGTMETTATDQLTVLIYRVLVMSCKPRAVRGCTPLMLLEKVISSIAGSA
jgi:hypothetical protein